MKTSTFTLHLMLVLFTAHEVSGQALLHSSYGTGLADGMIGPNEWQHASSAWIHVNNTDSVRVLIMNDETTLFLQFAGKLESANILFPEVMVDPLLDRTTTWGTDDWWFHVSATDCENQGEYGIFLNCLPDQVDWMANPNFTSGPPLTDTIEIAILLSKLSPTLSAGDTIGLGLMVTNTATVWKMWPDGADRYNTATWGELVLAGNGTGINAISGTEELNLSPVPAYDHLHIDHKWLIRDEPVTFKLFALTGACTLIKKLAGANDRDISLAGTTPGVYIAEITCSSGKKLHSKVVIQ